LSKGKEALSMDFTTRTIEINAEAGKMPIHVARPRDEESHPALIVVMEAFGLNDHIKDVAGRFAAEGFVTLAPDLYYRESSRVVGYDNLPEAIRLMSGLWDDKVVTDMEAVIGYVKAQPSVRADRIGITGFCMGGRVSFLTACRSQSITAAVPFYGGGIASGEKSERTPVAPIELASQLCCPVLAFFGSDDAFIPMTDAERVRDTLTKLGPQHEVVIYDGAPHGFFCNERDSYRPEAATDAWTRTVRFLHTHLG
jgi:carboxymethylenebutenolidase